LPSPVLDLRAFKLALAGPSVFWHFPVFYVLLSSGLSPDPLRLFLLLIVLVVSAIWGFLVNDYFDRESDARSGRMDSVHGHGLSKPRMYFLILFSALLSWVIVFAIEAETRSRSSSRSTMRLRSSTPRRRRDSRSEDSGGSSRTL